MENALAFGKKKKMAGSSLAKVISATGMAQRSAEVWGLFSHTSKGSGRAMGSEHGPLQGDKAALPDGSACAGQGAQGRRAAPAQIGARQQKGAGGACTASAEPERIMPAGRAALQWYVTNTLTRAVLMRPMHVVQSRGALCVHRALSRGATPLPAMEFGSSGGRGLKQTWRGRPPFARTRSYKGDPGSAKETRLRACALPWQSIKKPREKWLLAAWSSGMILASGSRGPWLDSQSSLVRCPGTPAFCKVTVLPK